MVKILEKDHIQIPSQKNKYFQIFVINIDLTLLEIVKDFIRCQCFLPKKRHFSSKNTLIKCESCKNMPMSMNRKIKGAYMRNTMQYAGFRRLEKLKRIESEINSDTIHYNYDAIEQVVFF